jgi:two-component system, response regulator PdtaR
MMNAPAIPEPLPLWLAALSPGTGQARHDASAEAKVKGAPLKVLIVEDEFFIALDTQEQVESLGHVVVGIAVSADQAVAMTEAEKPDVALMDIRLSGARDGIAAAIEIRNRYGVESIFVTANTDPATLKRAQSMSPVGVLQKPLTASHLRQQLAQMARE